MIFFISPKYVITNIIYRFIEFSFVDLVDLWKYDYNNDCFCYMVKDKGKSGGFMACIHIQQLSSGDANALT